MNRVDVLVFGPHPDDLELGAGGTIAAHVAQGDSVGLCDLTLGEMGSNGTPEERRAESLAAARVLGAAWRVNLGWPDRAISGVATQTRTAVELIRRARPRTIAVPFWTDRHPDHEAASRVLTDTIFNSGLRRYEADGEPWRPEWTCYYFINDMAEPSFVVDVSAHYETKWRALECYQSQFAPATAGAVATRLTAPTFRRLIESRDSQFGARIGVAHAEGFVVRQPVLRRDLFAELPAR